MTDKRDDAGDNEFTSWEDFSGTPQRTEPKAAAQAKTGPSAQLKELMKVARKLATTVLESKTDRSARSAQARELLAETRKVAKTLLDELTLKNIVSSTMARQEQKLTEEIESRGPQVFKPFQWIEKYEKAAPCSQTWNEVDTGQRIRRCRQCGLNVYDFTGMEKPDAEELVKTTESSPDCKLYRRKDGKFLSKDCPVGVRNKLTMAVLVAGSSLALTGILALSTAQPKTTGSQRATGGTIIYHAGKSLPSSASSASASQHASYARQLESACQANFTPPENIRKAEEKVVVNLRLSRSGAPTGFMLMQSSGSADADKYIVKAATSQHYPAPPFKIAKEVDAEFSFEGSKVSVVIP